MNFSEGDFGVLYYEGENKSQVTTKQLKVVIQQRKTIEQEHTAIQCDSLKTKQVFVQVFQGVL